MPERERVHRAIPKLLNLEQQIVPEAYDEKTRKEEQKAKALIELQALHDDLTGLSNRRMFLQELKQAIERQLQKRTRFAVLMLD